MMIHEKIMSGQFLLDRKNDRSSMLHSSHHHLAHHSHHHQPPSPPMPAMKMDLYSAYAYQQQLQQHLIGSSNAHHKSAFCAPTEVLDLSRRCDSVETPRKTPSPYQTNSSHSTNSPSVSPADSQVQQQPAPPVIPTNLLYSAQAQQHQQQPHAGITLPSAIASLYPAFYYPGNVKQEPISASSPPLPPAESTKEFAPVAASNLLQTFASAAAAASVSSMHVDVPEPHSPDTSNNHFSSSHQQYSHKSHITTPTSSTAASASASTDVKSTRPFKAFPRDPLVIAANFAATDVLLDNPRVERYTEYRKRVLEQIRNSNGGSRTITNPKMRRTNSRSGSFNDGSSNNNSENEERNAGEESSDCDSNAGNFEKMTTSTSSTGSNADGNLNGSSMHQTKDAAYYERRRKNNAAAKKSRDRRRIKEDEIAIRAAYLERQNIELLCQIDGLKAQLAAFTSKVGA